MENRKQKTTGTATRLAVLVFIVAAVLGIFFWKKSTGEPARVSTPPAASGEAVPFRITALDMDSILSYNLPVMIDFGADECGPCQAMAPALEEMHDEAAGAAVVHFIDVWVNPAEAKDFPIQVVPTQLFLLADGSPYRPTETFAEEIGVSFTSYNDEQTGELRFTMHMGGLTIEQMRAILRDMGAAL